MDGPVGGTDDLVSATALAATAARAVESSRPDGLVHDPFAAPLVEALLAASSSGVELPTEWPASFEGLAPRDRRLLLSSVFVGLRTRFIDDYLAGIRADADPVPEVDLPRQVVIFGAGLDTRAFRLDWPGRTEIFELDRPEVLLYKRDVLREMGAGPRCEWFAVPTDLVHSWDYSLIAAGFDRRRRTAWIVEGVLPYLRPDAQQEAVATIARLSAPGSRAVVEHTPPTVASPDVPTPPDPAEVLAGRGWSVQDHTMAELAERYGRSLAEDALPTPLASGPGGVPDADALPATRGFITAQLDDVVA